MVDTPARPTPAQILRLILALLLLACTFYILKDMNETAGSSPGRSGGIETLFLMEGMGIIGAYLAVKSSIELPFVRPFFSTVAGSVVILFGISFVVPWMSSEPEPLTTSATDTPFDRISVIFEQLSAIAPWICLAAVVMSTVSSWMIYLETYHPKQPPRESHQ